MNVFELNRRLIHDYSSYIRSFIQIRDKRIHDYTEKCLNDGLLWPEPLIQLNPSFEPGEWVDELVNNGTLHQECSKIFRSNKDLDGIGQPLRLHRHQVDAIKAARSGKNYVLTTGTGSGKSLAYIIPIVNYILQHGSGRGIQAIVIYPMNALANSQYGELEKFLCYGYPEGQYPVTFEKYTGQESEEEKQRIIENPPDILLTNMSCSN
ncbi:DEAD/DEAH box helicase [Desulfallas sp. Bu1-1]|uniref:DEAD/DEAH box helicase n=1 Tax=Desulfallas sp. Bu1-1 TaxID=2787620 RepID=UPI00189DBFC9|nr:DEAD/DEAH box helicase [Desulfallas sp. Bu1-1]MBF7081694.1 DEAD/DEAH box helicase [Desulfallas sp. Bu1-1]